MPRVTDGFDPTIGQATQPAAPGADPKCPGVVFVQDLHLHAGQSLAQTQYRKANAVKPGQSFASAQPQVAVASLNNRIDGILRQAGLRAPGSNDQAFEQETLAVCARHGRADADHPAACYDSHPESQRKWLTTQASGHAQSSNFQRASSFHLLPGIDSPG